MSAKTTSQGKRILVLGATGTLGLAVVNACAHAGVTVVVSARDSERLRRLTVSKEIESVPCDLSDSAAIAELAKQVRPLDGVVYAAGLAPVKPLKYLKDDELRLCFQLNAEAPLQVTRELLRQKKLNEGASIVWISSVAAGGGTKGYAAYAGSKAALEASMRCLALELAGRRIRVNAVAPGMVRGEMADASADAISSEVLEQHFAGYPLGEGRPVDVANAVVFLLSEKATWMTGVTMPVDGGYGLQVGGKS
ncbi:SDR family NAD(P)-dependent oxidoreductase [Coraliomargarita parva]|uniref:SDR family NAD(P)-dependent oxidoreductase n=1 Tax=Coraliomargarita parva TaxID=3014050 RepID=UPI0022B5D17B|nr:SDR family oxidoreductase [Coraliomargarita parva]